MAAVNPTPGTRNPKHHAVYPDPYTLNPCIPTAQPKTRNKQAGAVAVREELGDGEKQVLFSFLFSNLKPRVE